MTRLQHRLAAVALLVLFTLLFSTPSPAQFRDPLPVPDLPGYRTLKCDLHTHTVFSDGEVWPTTRIVEAWRDGLDVISLTDHAGYNPHDDDVKPDLARPYAIARRLAEQLGIILIPGVELAQGDTHCNALFVTDPNAFMGLDLKQALEQARAQNAFVFWNHPGWKQTAEWFPLIASLHEAKLIHGVELVNGRTFYPEAFPWIEEKRLTIISNSDIHAPISPQYPARTRPVTLVFARTADEAGVREALFARRAAAWMGGEVWGSEQLLRGLWDHAVRVENPELKWRDGMRRVALRIYNRSAIPFQIRVLESPGWLSAGRGEVRAESIAGLPLSIAPEAPRGLHRLELKLEIHNLHTRPEQNLIVQIPLSIELID